MVVFIVSFTAILVCGRLYKVLPCDYLVSRSRLATCWHMNGHIAATGTAVAFCLMTVGSVLLLIIVQCTAVLLTAGHYIYLICTAQ